MGCEGCVSGVNIFTTFDALVVHAKAQGAQFPSILLVEQSDELVDVAGNIAECCRQFKHFRAHLVRLAHTGKSHSLSPRLRWSQCGMRGVRL